MITREDIEKVFGPWLQQISQKSLREQVVQVWVTGCQKGGWTQMEELEKMPFTLATDPQGISFLEHTKAVTQGALALAYAQIDNYTQMPYSINRDRLIAGGLLHDIGKLLEIESDGQGGWRMSQGGRCMRHPISGVILAAETGVPQDILNMIACHAKEGEGRNQVVETVLVHQADFATFNPLVMMKAKKLIEEVSHGKNHH